jgi:phosphoribosyl 1,2-cyclic phosphodiesterase
VTVRFWGVRGTIACPGPATLRYGGNTACVEVRCGDHLTILDGGTGLRPLGLALQASGQPVDADLLYGHTHLDHILGLPFFAPAYVPDNALRLWAGHLLPAHGLAKALHQMMSAPLFPVLPDVFKAQMAFRDFRCGESLQLRPSVVIRTAALNHPDGGTAYRIEHAGRSLVYATDTEHRPGHPDENILRLAAGADLLIYDSTYTDDEFPARLGWGHSTWQEGVRLADAAKVGTLVIFHHDPGHDDAFMDRIAAEAEGARPGTVVAREGMVLEL